MHKCTKGLTGHASACQLILPRDFLFAHSTEHLQQCASNAGSILSCRAMHNKRRPFLDNVFQNGPQKVLTIRHHGHVRLGKAFGASQVHFKANCDLCWRVINIREHWCMMALDVICLPNGCRAGRMLDSMLGELDSFLMLLGFKALSTYKVPRRSVSEIERKSNTSVMWSASRTLIPSGVGLEILFPIKRDGTHVSPCHELVLLKSDSRPPQ